MINAKREFLDVQIEKSIHAEAKRDFEMKYKVSLEERNSLESKYKHLEEEY